MPRGIASWSAWLSSLAFFLMGLFPLFNADAYGHLAQGRQIAAAGGVPHVDPFSFWKPEPQPWHNYEWAYDWLTWLAYSSFGADALVLIKCLFLACLGYSLVVLAFRLADGDELAGPIAATALLLSLPVARFRFTMRPQIIGLLFPALLLVGVSVLYRSETSNGRKRSVLAALTVLHVVWVNMHGSHLLGLAITAIFAATAFRTPALRWLLALLGLQLAATACTPFGFAIATDAIAHVARPEYRELVVEWAAWSAKDPLRLLVAPSVVSLFVLIAARPVVRASRFGLGYGIFAVLLTIMAFRSMRFVAHQLLFCAPFIAAGLAQQSGFRARSPSTFLLVGAAAAACWLWTAQLVPALGFGFGEPREEHPWASAGFIERHVDDPRVLASLQDSWMLMFSAPSAKLLVDGRVPFYGPEMITQVLKSFADEELFSEQLSKYRVNTVVIDHTRADHIAATEMLQKREDWGLLFVEDGHSLFVQRDATGLPPFQSIAPGYRVGRLLDPSIDDRTIRAEATRLNAQPNTTAMQAWHQGIELLRPLARDAERAGIRRAATGGEAHLARAAYGRLSIAAERFPGFTTIELYRAMAALAFCDVPKAHQALGRALYSGPSRGTSLVSLELSLRAGSKDGRAVAEERLETLLADPDNRDDRWLAAIAADRDVRCN